MKDLHVHPIDMHLCACAGSILSLRRDVVKHIKAHIEVCELCRKKFIKYMDENIEDYRLDVELKQKQVVSETYSILWNKIVEFKDVINESLAEIMSKLSKAKDAKDVLLLTHDLKFPTAEEKKQRIEDNGNIFYENEEQQILSLIKAVLSVLTNENIEISKRATFAESLCRYLRKTFPDFIE